MNIFRSQILLCAFLIAGITSRCFALEPSQVFLIANKNMPESLAVAEYYQQRRAIPKDNLILLDLPKTEDIVRADYNSKLALPVREALKERKDKIKCLLCIYGVPLRVGGDAPNDAEKKQLEKVEAERKTAQEKLKPLEARIKELEPKAKADPKGDDAKELDKARDEHKKLSNNVRLLENRQRWLSHAESQAAVDNELMLLWWEDYELRRFQFNLLHFQVPESKRKGKPPVLMTARLDGPTPEITKRLVDDAVEVEKTGLKGKVYVDARDIRFDPKSEDGYGYGGYDESMREMAALLKDQGKMDVILDNKPAVFTPNSCPECALYCGWYSHGNFVDSCGFVKGAVAWHLASSEAVSLRRKDLNLWCRNILEKGAAATLGPVGEPYTIGFPKPAEFFGFLVTGEYTLVECYSRTLVLTSWMCTLIGDPLYNPYKATPKLKSEQVTPSPKGGKFFLHLKDETD